MIQVHTATIRESHGARKKWLPTSPGDLLGANGVVLLGAGQAGFQDGFYRGHQVYEVMGVIFCKSIGWEGRSRARQAGGGYDVCHERG